MDSATIPCLRSLCDDTNDSQQADTDFHLKGKVILVAEVRRKRKQISLSVRISFIYT